MGKDYADTERRWRETLVERNVLTLDGHGCSVNVERGELVLRPGGSYARREAERRIIKGVHSVSAVVVMGGNGAISLSAIQWCAAQKVGLFAVDRDGALTSVVATSPAHNVGVRRLQYNANPVAVAKEVLKAKLAAGAAARPKVKAKLVAAAAEVDKARSVESLRLIEARAATVYWGAWNLMLQTVGRHFPEHWRSFMQRTSSLSGSGRKATHPVNAILNYSYAILAGQVQRALEARGFDVAVGHLHSDSDGRPSLVYDLMEPLRPKVDEQVLTWVMAQKWRRTDFVVDAEGVVRLHSALARVVVQKAVLASKPVADVVRWYMETLPQ
ncbi:MAG: CRISPR-associated endonuclease Cas1 [Gammaproteobacteria bacterium]|nr:CRISPR-associated endonuclease Cas1 [Gammaproteobacteria bacterium]MBI5615114.1 CRISPR-associated endonuclease Cas1 [Gammaproteobacteria bacterium]